MHMCDPICVANVYQLQRLLRAMLNVVHWSLPLNGELIVLVLESPMSLKVLS